MFLKIFAIVKIFSTIIFQGNFFFVNSIEIYRKAVGYNSTATEFKTFTAKPEIISALNPYTWANGRSVSMHTIPPDPQTVKMKTILGQEWMWKKS